MELGLVPLMDRAVSKGVFGGQPCAQEDFKQSVCSGEELYSCPVGCLA